MNGPDSRVQAGSRRFLVTGAGSGIGAAVAARLAQDGAQVALLGRRRDPLDRVADRCRASGGAALVVQADVTDEMSVEAAVNAAGSAFGGLDGLVNNAGVSHFGPVESTTLAAWQEVLAVNLTGPFLVTRAALSWLRRGEDPSVVQIASTLGLVGLPNAAAYCAAKAGLVNWTRALALELGAEGIRVNAICPGPVATEMLAADRGDGLDTAQRMAELAARHPLGRVARPEQIAATVAHLLSGQAAHTTGAVIVVDGGMTAGFSH